MPNKDGTGEPNRPGNKATNSLGAAGLISDNGETGSFPYARIEDFDELAALIAPNRPQWLPRFLEEWTASIFLSRAVEQRQPTRAEVKRMLDRIIESADLLQRALREPFLCEFLNAGGVGPMDLPTKFHLVIGEIRLRAIGAAKLPNLVAQTGKPKAGRGPALLDGAISAQTYCALLIVESWKWFRGDYPAPASREAAKAIDLYWKLSGGQKHGWGNDGLNSWRHHISKSLKIKADVERDEFRRHLREAARWDEFVQPSS